MKRILLIGSKSPGEKNDVAALKEMADKFGKEAEISVAYLEDLVFDISLNKQTITNRDTGKDISDTDIVVAFNWYRGGKQSMYKEVALTIALYLESKQVKYWNEEMVMQRSTSKLSAAMQLALLKCDVPNTIYSLSANNVAAGLSFPLILKAAQASRGRDNFLINSQEELEEKLKATKSINPYLIQEYIPNVCDLRIVCFDSKPSLVIKRSRTDSRTHLNNVSQGANAELISINELDTDIIQACSTICNKMGRNIAGIDLLPASDSKRQVFLEVNAIPQLTSGAFVEEKAEALVSALIEDQRGSTL